MRGLEIGPLYRPRVTKADGDVRYVDHCTTQELREIYRWNSVVREHLDQIVDVDYVVKPGQSLRHAVNGDGPFDYIIASHVIEHVANPLGWLSEAEAVLADNGLISLVIPDKRYCFDINRSETRPQDWVDWYFRELDQPSFVHVFDFYAHAVTIDGSVDTVGLWAGTVDYSGVRRADVPDADIAAFNACLDLQATGRYMDVHTGVYTPASFLGLLALSARLGLMNFAVGDFTPTPVNTLEFYVTLRRAEKGSTGQILGSIAKALEVETTKAASPRPTPAGLAPSPQDEHAGSKSPEVDAFVGPSKAELSDKERSLIAAKRALMKTLRAGVVTLRRLVRE